MLRCPAPAHVHDSQRSSLISLYISSDRSVEAAHEQFVGSSLGRTVRADDKIHAVERRIDSATAAAAPTQETKGGWKGYGNTVERPRVRVERRQRGAEAHEARCHIAGLPTMCSQKVLHQGRKGGAGGRRMRGGRGGAVHGRPVFCPVMGLVEHQSVHHRPRQAFRYKADAEGLGRCHKDDAHVIAIAVLLKRVARIDDRREVGIVFAAEHAHNDLRARSGGGRRSRGRSEAPERAALGLDQQLFFRDKNTNASQRRRLFSIRRSSTNSSATTVICKLQRGHAMEDHRGDERFPRPCREQQHSVSVEAS